MNSNTFHLVVASVGETHFEGPVASATFPGEVGTLAILPHHEPFVTTLKSGAIKIQSATEGAKNIPIDGGVLEVSGNRAIVLL